MVIYFSGTGNSKYCAEMIANRLGDKAVNLKDYMKNGIAGEFVSEKPYVFVAPVYAWQLPHVFNDFLKSASFDGCKDAYFVITCGGGISAAGVKAKGLTEEIGLNYKGTLEVVMPDNYMLMYDLANEKKCEKRIAKATKVVEEGIEVIRSGKDFAEPKVNVLDTIKSGPVNSAFYAFSMSAKAFRTTDKCIGCGMCADLCPLNNIKLVDGKPTWGKNCTQCVACICGCPTEAIEYGKGTVGRRRYRGPVFQG